MSKVYDKIKIKILNRFDEIEIKIYSNNSISIKDNGSIYWQKYIYGKTAVKLTAIGKTLETGMHVHFKPDNKIFKENIIDFNFLKFRFQ